MDKSTTFTCSALLVLVLTGCGSVFQESTDTAKLSANLPEFWQANLSTSVAKPQFEEIWGMTLPKDVEHLLSIAVKDNKALYISALKLKQAEQDLHISSGLLWPEAKVSLNERHFQKLENGDKQSTQLSSLGLSVRWELDLWNKLSAENQQQTWLMSAKESELEALRKSIQAQVLLAWLAVIEQNNLLRLNQENIENQMRRLSMSLMRLDNGLASSLDVRNVRTTLMRTRAEQKNIRFKRQKAIRNLNLLLNKPPTDKLLTKLEPPELAKSVTLSSPKNILLNRPDIKAAEAKLLAAGFAWKSSELKKLPKLTLDVNVDTRQDHLGDLFDVNYWLTSITASLVQPIFYRGVLDAQAKKAKFQQDIELANFEMKLLRAWKEVEDTVHNDLVLEERKALLDRALLEARAAELQTENQYSAGLASSFELLSAQRTRTLIESDRIKLAIARINNRIQLKLALGLPQVPPPTSTS
ncbi:TolC family protein [Thalassotalea sp. PLHSN55]|uniref:TolC family protein n=1 Tax=Thalassotalea sp. PLHSN55 TaxID=3435888 RepID=UPI003F8340D7